MKSLFYHGQTWSINKRGEICLVHVFSSCSCISPRHMELMDLFVAMLRNILIRTLRSVSKPVFLEPQITTTNLPSKFRG